MIDLEAKRIRLTRVNKMYLVLPYSEAKVLYDLL